MNNVFVFGIGGTGIRVMKSIVMLMASGMDTHGYTVVPIIIDPHLDLQEKRKLDQLIESYRTLYRKTTTTVGADGGETTHNPLTGFFGSELKTVADLNGQSNDTQQAAGAEESFRDYIRVGSLATTDINQFFVQTLFSSENLNSSLSVGFRGNPNVGTVVLGDMIEGLDWFKSFKASCSEGDRVFIISSIFGGTGASGYPLLEKKIRGAQGCPLVQKAMMGAVTVLPYYRLDDPAKNSSRIDSANFYTKTKAALAYYKDNVAPDILYYVGEQKPTCVYENDETAQNNKAHFIELVAASALFDFLARNRPEKKLYCTRCIDDDKESLDRVSLGSGYDSLVKCVADYMLFCTLVRKLPNERFFPLEKNRGFDGTGFYKDEAFGKLQAFTEIYKEWYEELASNKRAFAPLNTDTDINENWVKGITLAAKDESYYLLQMVKASNKVKESHGNKFRFFVQFAYEAINHYTKKINPED